MTLPDGVNVQARIEPDWQEILSAEALGFLAGLHRAFNARRLELLAARRQRQARLDAGETLDFLPETADIRAGDWKVRPAPADLQDRRVEITGPVDRKMIINALNSGAKVFMADFEDSSTPSLANMLEGQINLRDAVRRKITFTDPNSGKHYALKDDPAVLIVRPRGWHMEERHLLVDGQPMSASLFDFGLHVFHNASEALARGTGPYFYLPKMESHQEAALWSAVFHQTEQALGLATGTIRATVLIETLPAAFEIEEILYALRDHIVGLNCGRWDYIFSIIKVMGKRPDFLLPDRAQVTMTSHALRSYSLRVIQLCHKRGAHAMGGMAAQIPIRNNEAANQAALDKVRADKRREATDGHDGTWVAHPALVPIALEEFNAVMPGPNQLDRLREDVSISAADLLTRPEGEITETGLRTNIRVGIQYIEAWLGGLGCVPLYNLMEDAATAEISRAQIWQWLRHGAALDDGRIITAEMVRQFTNEEMAGVRTEIGAERYDHGNFAKAIELFLELSLADELSAFLTLPAYEQVLTLSN